MARILVIEDNPANLELMVYLLQAFGHAPLSAVDGEAGVALAQAERPDIIVCDVHLPAMDGYAVARHLKSDHALAAVPLVAVTALAMVGDREQILAAGFDGYISKPIVPETFVGQVEAFLRPGQRAAKTPAAAPPSLREAMSAPTPNGATVLVVDDSPVNLDLVRSVLEPFGYTVITTTSVRHAIALAAAHLPQVIVSDLHMPDQDGFDLIRTVKSDPALRQIVIIIHSATVKSELDRREAIQLGATRFLARPLEPPLLLAEIESCLHNTPES